MSTMFSEMDVRVGQMNGSNSNGIVNGVANGQGNNNNNCNQNNSLEEQRALQLAFELSMLGLSDTLNGVNDLSVNVINHHLQQNQPMGSPSHNSMTNGTNGAGGLLGNSLIGNSGGCPSNGLSAFTGMLPSLEDRSKKSQNMTECVPVPSSEHVAEIVGRQGELLDFFPLLHLLDFF